MDHAGDIKLCQVGPCGPRRDVGPTLRGRETGVPARPGEVEDGPREPPPPCPVSYALVTRSQKRITAPPVYVNTVISIHTHPPHVSTCYNAAK